MPTDASFTILFALRYQHVVIFYNFGQIPIGSRQIMSKNDKKKEVRIPGEIKARRNNKVTVFFNDKEMEAIDAYCKKYKIESRAALMREMTLRAVMGKFLEDYPTLFEKQDLDRLIVY